MIKDPIKTAANIKRTAEQEIMSSKYVNMYDKLIQLFRNNIIKIVFIKMNGDKRVMRATRNGDIISQFYSSPKTLSTDAHDERVNKEMQNCELTVFDVDINQFRKFKLNRLVSIEIEQKLR